MQIVAVDLGGTHARFAIAEVTAGKVRALSDIHTFKAADYPGFAAAWAAYGAALRRPLPPAAALAVAGPVDQALIRLTNNDWTIDRAALVSALGLERLAVLNDFGAIGHAVAQVPVDSLQHVTGPHFPLTLDGVVTICGPGTGLGVAQLIRRAGDYTVVETEGGHIGFAPQDGLEDALVQTLRERHGRVSIERIVSGQGILAFYQALAGDISPTSQSNVAVWTAALDGSDPVATAALEHFLAAFGAVVGDLALAQGAAAVVLAGGLGYRLRDKLADSRFAERFVAKGRFREKLATIPVKVLTHEQPGLFGAAAAFAHEMQA